MTKPKHHEFIKVMAIATLCIGLFSAVFIGVNRLALAATANETETVAIAATAAPIVDESAADDDYAEDYQPVNDYADDLHSPNLTVLIHPETQQNGPGANAILAEDAAIIGAQYIHDVLGENIDGMYVMMEYFAHPSFSRPLWFGMVADTAEDLENYTPIYGFTLCAVSGERINIRVAAITFQSPAVDYITTHHLSNLMFPEHPVDDTYFPGEMPAAFVAAIGDTCIDQLWEELMSGITPPAHQIVNYKQIARAYAAKHFANTEIVSIQFDMARHSGFFILDDNGNLTAILAQLIFSVTDCTGRSARVVLAYSDELLLQVICTQHNDIVPGFESGM